MFSLSGPCVLLFLLCFIASWTRVVVVLFPCIVCVALLMDYVFLACLIVFVNCLVYVTLWLLGLYAHP